MAASPGMVRNIFALYPKMDIRDVLPTIQVPTLVLHRRDDRMVSVEMGRYLADHIPGAKFVELDGTDHLFFTGDADAVVDEIEEFLTGVRPLPAVERVLATVLFTDVVDSTKRAVELGDERWKELLTRHDAQVRRQLERFQGREVNTTGDGFLATFDGPARAIRCAVAIRDAVGALGLEVRAGVHTGEVEMRDADISGIAVHLAARVAADRRSGRGARLPHGRRPRRRLGAHVHRPRRARPEGRPRRVALVRGRGRDAPRYSVAAWIASCSFGLPPPCCDAMSFAMSPCTRTLPCMNACMPAFGSPETNTCLAVA